MLQLICSYIFGGIAAEIVALFSTVLITRMLSVDDYAKAMMYEALMSVFYIFSNMGMDKVILRFFYEDEYKDQLGLLFYRSLFFIFLGSLVIAVVVFFWGNYILNVLAIHQGISLYFMIFNIILLSLNRLLILIPRLLEQASVYGILIFSRELLTVLGFIFAYFFLSKSYFSVIFSWFFTSVILVMFLLFFYRKKILTLPDKKHRIFKTKALGDVFKYGSPSLFFANIYWIFDNLDRFLIVKWLGYHQLGIYTAAFTLAGLLLFIKETFDSAWEPRMSHMLIHRPFKSKKIFFSTFEKLSFFLTVIFILGVLFKDCLILFLGPDFRQAVDVFPWLLFAPYFESLSSIVLAGIVKSKKSYWHIYNGLLLIVLNLVGCSLLIPLLGLQGAAITVALSFALSFFARVHIAFRYYRFPIRWLRFITYLGFLVLFVMTAHQPALQYVLILIFLLLSFFYEMKPSLKPGLLWFGKQRSQNPVLY